MLTERRLAELQNGHMVNGSVEINVPEHHCPEKQKLEELSLHLENIV